MESVKPSNTSWGRWGNWWSQQLEGDRFDKLAASVPIFTLIGTLPFTKDLKNSIAASMITATILPFWKILTYSGPVLDVKIREIDPEAVSLQQRNIESVSSIDEVQDIFNCTINCGNIETPVYLFGCSCTELSLFEQKNLEYILRDKKCSYCTNEDTGQFKVVTHLFLKSIMTLLQEGKSDAVQETVKKIASYPGALEGSGPIDEKSANSIPIINQEGEVYLAPKKENTYYLPKGFKIDSTLLKLMQYIEKGSPLVATQN